MKGPGELQRCLDVETHCNLRGVVTHCNLRGVLNGSGGLLQAIGQRRNPLKKAERVRTLCKS